MQAVSVPLGIKDPQAPNIASTFWRTVIDQKARVMVYDSATSPNSFWVSVDGLDLKAGAPVRQLPLTGRVYAGEASSKFVPAKPFPFLGVVPKP